VTRRTDRVGDLIRAELALLIQREMSDPRVRLATPSEVHVSSDLRHARVMVSMVGGQEQRDEAVAALRHAAGFLRRQLARRLELRAVPELDFVLDRGAEHSVRMAEILEKLHHDDEDAT
jgi:ribosome-binding factor A